jgi:hypothetical protein
MSLMIQLALRRPGTFIVMAMLIAPAGDGNQRAAPEFPFAWTLGKPRLSSAHGFRQHASSALA